MLDKLSATELRPQSSFYFLNLKQGLTKLTGLALNSQASGFNPLSNWGGRPVSLDWTHS